MENEIYVIEVLFAPGFWELATDTYFTDSNSAEDEKKHLEDGMRKLKRKETYRIKKLKNGNIS